MSTRIHINLDDELLKRVDEVRGDIPRSRFLVRAVEAFLNDREIGASEINFAETAKRFKHVSRAEAFRRATQK